MNPKNTISYLEEDSIKSLFEIKIGNENKQDFQISKNFLIIQLRKMRKNDKDMYTATFRDKSLKYNGFLFTNIIPNEEPKENSLINVKSISPRYISNNLNKVFIIKKYKIILQYFNIDILPKAISFKELNDTTNQNNNINNNHNNDIIIDIKNDDNDYKNIKSISKETPIYTSLNQLTTFSKDFIIYVRILKKSDIKLFNSNNLNNRQVGKYFYFIVLDIDGNEMQCICFNKSVDQFYNIISEGKIYEIKGGYIKLNEKKFTTIKSDYKIILDENSKIIEKKDDGKIKEKTTLKITKISEIQNIKLYSILDLCAIVLEIGEKAIRHTRNGDQPMKKLIIGDISKYKIEFSLWRIHASIEVKVSDILLIKNAKVGEFNGKNLSTYDETTIQINPSNSIKEVFELDNFIKNYKGEFNELEDLNELFQKKFKEKVDEKYNISYIKDTLDSIDAIDEVNSFSKICATVTQIIHNEKNYYMGCSDRNCKRKLIFDNEKNKYSCPNCKRLYDNPTYYYTLSLRVKDASCEHWIDIFGKTAENILKISAEDYRKLLMPRDENKLREISKLIEFKTFYFYVKPKLQMYNTISKKKLYASKIECIDVKNECRKMVFYLKNLLKIDN